MVAQLETFLARERHPAQQKLARQLLETGKVAQTSLDRAIRLAQESGERLERVLTQLGLVSERDIAEALSAILNFPVAVPDDYPLEPVAEHCLSPKFLKEVSILPLAEHAENLTIAMIDPHAPWRRARPISPPGSKCDDGGRNPRPGDCAGRRAGGADRP